MVWPKTAKNSSSKALIGFFLTGITNKSCYLDALVRVRHHGNQKVYENDHRDQHVDAEHDLEQVGRPGWLVRLQTFGRLHNQLVVGGLAEHAEKQQLERSYWVHFHWEHQASQYRR